MPEAFQIYLGMIISRCMVNLHEYIYCIKNEQVKLPTEPVLHLSNSLAYTDIYGQPITLNHKQGQI